MDIPSISAIVAAIGVIVGVVLTVLQLRDLVKMRQTEIFVSLYLHAVEKEMVESIQKVWNLEVEDYNDFVKKYSLPFSETATNTTLQKRILGKVA